MSGDYFYRLSPLSGLLLMSGMIQWEVDIIRRQHGVLLAVMWTALVVTAAWAAYILWRMWRSRPRRRTGPPAPWAKAMADSSEKMRRGTR